MDVLVLQNSFCAILPIALMVKMEKSFWLSNQISCSSLCFCTSGLGRELSLNYITRTCTAPLYCEDSKPKQLTLVLPQDKKLAIPFFESITSARRWHVPRARLICFLSCSFPRATTYAAEKEIPRETHPDEGDSLISVSGD